MQPQYSIPACTIMPFSFAFRPPARARTYVSLQAPSAEQFSTSNSPLSTMAAQEDDSSAAIPFDLLPAGHLARLIETWSAPPHASFSASHERSPTASPRLGSYVGASKSHPREARQWIDFGFYGRKLFLHILCWTGFGRGDEECKDSAISDDAIPLPSTFEIQALKHAVESYPEALHLADSKG